MGKSLNSGGIVVWPRPNQVAFTSLERKVIFITKSREKKQHSMMHLGVLLL